MLLRAQNVNATLKNTAKNAAKNAATSAAKNAATNAVSNTPKSAANKVAARPVFTMQSLWRVALWGSTAAVALFVAILTTRSDVGSQRVAVVLSSLHLARATSPHAGPATTQVASQAASQAANQATPSSFDAEAATRQLAQTVRGLAEDRDRLTARLAAVEHNVDDITGSISREIEAAKARPQPWPGDQAPVAATPATIAAVVSPVMPPPAGLTAPLPRPPAPFTAEATPPAAPALKYGIDIGGGLSTGALRARWAGIRSAHPQFFAGLQPLAAVRKGRSGRSELRLVVGPLTSPEAAAQLCASLAPLRLFCRPTFFEGQHLAQR